jgi:hypothetical protein
MRVRGVTIMMPVTIVYDGDTMDRDAAIGDFYRMLEEAEQAGLRDNRRIHISYGEHQGAVGFTPQAEGYLPQPSGGPADLLQSARPAPEPHQPAGEDRTALVDELMRRAQSCGVTEEDLDGLVHDLLSKVATSINNGGLGSQVAHLVEALGADRARAELEEVIATAR